MKVYNHRLEQDLRALEADLSSLTREQKAIVWTALVRAGLFKPKWPIRLGMGLNDRIFGGENGLARSVAAIGKLPPDVLDKEWDLFLAFLLRGRNADDPTSAGGFNRRDLTAFLKFAELAGWRPPD